MIGERSAGEMLVEQGFARPGEGTRRIGANEIMALAYQRS
jgi:hypothetical protein